MKEYADEALSSTSDDRPKLQLMLTEVGQIRPAALIVWKMDRIARNRIDPALAKKIIRDAGCVIHYVAEAISRKIAQKEHYSRVCLSPWLSFTHSNSSRIPGAT